MTDDTFPDTQIAHKPETEDLDVERWDATERDHRFADEGPSRGTYPDNGHTGVQMSPEGKIVATSTSDHNDIGEKKSDVHDNPDVPDQVLPGSVGKDEGKYRSGGGRG